MSASTSSDDMRELICKDQDLRRLRGFLLEGASSPPAAPVDDVWFANLRHRALKEG